MKKYETCQNKKRDSGYFVMTRYYTAPSGPFSLQPQFVKDTTSKGCRYMGHDTDPGCEGCQQEKDLEYIGRMKGCPQ